MIEIHIPTIPVSWAASQHRGNIHYNPKHKDKISTRVYISSQYRGAMITGIVALRFLFTFSKPKRPSSSIPLKKDCTNMQKFYEDCLKGIVIKDDRYVAKISSEKIYGIKDQVSIQIEIINDF
jgi:Holliday junction resolvase RusA-like endonuclease